MTLHFYEGGSGKFCQAAFSPETAWSLLCRTRAFRVLTSPSQWLFLLLPLETSENLGVVILKESPVPYPYLIRAESYAMTSAWLWSALEVRSRIAVQYYLQRAWP
jgi:hypothetical protein